MVQKLGLTVLLSSLRFSSTGCIFLSLEATLKELLKERGYSQAEEVMLKEKLV